MHDVGKRGVCMRGQFLPPPRLMSSVGSGEGAMREREKTMMIRHHGKKKKTQGKEAKTYTCVWYRIQQQELEANLTFFQVFVSNPSTFLACVSVVLVNFGARLLLPFQSLICILLLFSALASIPLRLRLPVG